VKGLLFRAAFSVMTEGERDGLRKAFQMASAEWSLRNIRSLVTWEGGRGWRNQSSRGRGAHDRGAAREQAELRRVCAEYPGEVTYRMSLLGAEEHDGVEFYELETGSSVLFEQSSIEREKVLYYTSSTFKAMSLKS
jgi:hypothetical protein